MRTNSPRRLTALPVILVALALVAGGCDVFSTTSSPVASATASGAATGTPASSQTASQSSAPTAAPTPTPTAAPTPTPTPVPSPKTCTPQAPTDASKDWKTLSAHDGDYSFKYPKDWEHLYGAILFRADGLLDPETLAGTGLPGDFPIKADLVRAPDVGIPNASVLIVPGVVTPAEDVYFRQELRYRTIANALVLRSDIEICLDGLTAYGIEFVFGAEETLQQSFYVVHNGRSYDFQWLATKAKPDKAIFDEMVRTWKWTPNFPVATPRPTQAPTAAPSGSAFVTAGMSASIVDGAPRADTSTFTTTLSKDLTSIYAVFVLRGSLFGRVEGDLLKGNRVLATLAVDYKENHTWGDFRINSASGFAPGTDYEMRIRYMETGEEITLTFAVE